MLDLFQASNEFDLNPSLYLNLLIAITVSIAERLTRVTRVRKVL